MRAPRAYPSPWTVLFVAAVVEAIPAAAAAQEPREPSREERLVWMLVNRARADPATELADCEECADRACYTAAPPLAWDEHLGNAARFHSSMLAAWRHGLTHTSPCALRADVATAFEAGCDGSAACACEGGAFLCTDGASCRTCATCTGFPARVGLFGGGPRAENIAIAGSAARSMHAFLTEPYDVSTCGYGSDSHGRPNGHRYNILAPDRTSIGAGRAGSYWTQDFGFGETPVGLAAAAHDPDAGPAVEVRVGYYGSVAPTSVVLNVDGVCTPMSLERGTALHGTLRAAITTGAACARYAIEIEGGEGIRRAPAAGSYGIGCDSDWSDVSPPRCGCTPRCEGRACGDDGCGGSCGQCGEGEACEGARCADVALDAGSPDASSPALTVDASSADEDPRVDASTAPDAGSALGGATSHRPGGGIVSRCAASPGHAHAGAQLAAVMAVLALVEIRRRGVLPRLSRSAPTTTSPASRTPCARA